MTTYLRVGCAGSHILMPTANVESLTDVSGLVLSSAPPPILDARVLIGAEDAPALPVRMDRPVIIWRSEDGQRRFAVVVDSIAAVVEIEDGRFEPLPRVPRTAALLFDRVLRIGGDQPLHFRLRADLDGSCAARRSPWKLKAARVARHALGAPRTLLDASHIGALP